MKLTLRNYRNEEDYWHLSEFLLCATILNQRRWRSWHVSRLDYWRWFAIPNPEKLDPDSRRHP